MTNIYFPLVSNKKYFYAKTGKLITALCMQHCVTCLSKAYNMTCTLEIPIKIVINCYSFNHTYRQFNSFNL